jgi:predicted RNase H-like HicB family nuclease
MRYFALLDGKPGNYGVVVPDLPGCTSAGKTADASYRNAIAAVRLWVEDALADGEKLPRARSLMDMLADRDIRRTLAAGAALMVIPLVRDSGAAGKGQYLGGRRHAGGDRRGGGRAWDHALGLHCQRGIGKNPPRDLMAEHEPSIGATSEWFTPPEYFGAPQPRPLTAKTGVP